MKGKVTRVRNGRPTAKLVMEKYLQGTGQVDIAEELGITPAAVSYHLRELNNQIRNETLVQAHEAKALDLARANLLLKAWLPYASDPAKPNPVAAAIVLKVLERRARYLGLDDQQDLSLTIDNRTVQVTSESLTALAQRVLEDKSHGNSDN